MQDRTVLDVLTPDCVLLQRTVTPAPMVVTHVRGENIVAVRTRDFPEVIVFRLSLH